MKRMHEFESYKDMCEFVTGVKYECIEPKIEKCGCCYSLPSWLEIQNFYKKLGVESRINEPSNIMGLTKDNMLVGMYTLDSDIVYYQENWLKQPVRSILHYYDPIYNTIIVSKDDFNYLCDRFYRRLKKYKKRGNHWLIRLLD